MNEQPKQKPKPKAARMKVTMQTLLAGPHGVARRGTVLDLPETEAKELVERNFAREYDRERDAKAPVGLVTGKDK